MGSPLRLTVVGITETRAAAAWDAVSAAFEGFEQALSRFRPTSDLVTLNRRAGDRRLRPRPRAPVRRRGGRGTGVAPDRRCLRSAHPGRPRAPRLPGRRPRRRATCPRNGGRRFAGTGAGWPARRGRPRRWRSPPRSTWAGSARASRSGGGSRSCWQRCPRSRTTPTPRAARWPPTVRPAPRRTPARSSRPAAISSPGAPPRRRARGSSGSKTPQPTTKIAVIAVAGRRRLHLLDRRARLDDGRRAGRPPPRRPAHGRAGWRRPALRDRRGARSRLGRGLVEDPLPRGRRRDRPAGAGRWALRPGGSATTGSSR